MTTSQDSALIRLVNEALDAGEALDPEGMARPYAEDAVLEFPFAPEGFPARVEGKDEIVQFFRQFPKYYRKIRFLDRRFEPLADGAGLVAQYRGEWENLKGRPYNNTYINVLRFRGDTVVHMREFFNPQIWVDSLG
jgi:uncharacterized protein